MTTKTETTARRWTNIRVHYRITRFLGKGRHGSTHHAFSQHLFISRAIKKTREPTKEAAILAHLDHENIVRVHEEEYDPKQGMHTIIMDYVEGKTLQDMIAKQKLSENTVLAISAQIFSAIRYLAHQGITHRDLNMKNIKVTKKGVVKILDFGLATNQKNPASQDNTRSGPPSFLPASDLFSLGMLLYELTTGEHLLHPKSRGMTSSLHRKKVGKLKEEMYDRCSLKRVYQERILAKTPPHIQEIILACIGTTTQDLFAIEALFLRNSQLRKFILNKNELAEENAALREQVQKLCAENKINSTIPLAQQQQLTHHITQV